jgi:hypothetical protein
MLNIPKLNKVLLKFEIFFRSHGLVKFV